MKSPKSEGVKVKGLSECMSAIELNYNSRLMS